MFISERLRKELQRDKRSLNEISRESKLHRTVLKRFRDGKRLIGLSTADKLAKFYDLSLKK